MHKVDASVPPHLLACPWCGAEVDAVSARASAACDHCGRPVRFEGEILVWAAPETAPATPKRNLRELILRQFNPLVSRLSPLRYFSDWRVEGYYRRTVSDSGVAQRWSDHYLAALALPRGAAVLDHGCGRGRNVGMLTQLGFRVGAQDLQPSAWWKRLGGCTFQAVPAAVPRLPWTDGAFQAVLDVEVIHHLDESQLHNHAAEVFRVLAPGGAWILLEANSDSYGARLPLKYCGRLHSLEHVRRLAAEVGFNELDRSFEGLYTPVLPNLVNFVRKQLWPGPLMIEDFDSRLAAMVPAHRRALWLLRLQKPVLHG